MLKDLFQALANKTDEEIIHRALGFERDPYKKLPVDERSNNKPITPDHVAVVRKTDAAAVVSDQPEAPWGFPVLIVNRREPIDVADKASLLAQLHGSGLESENPDQVTPAAPVCEALLPPTELQALLLRKLQRLQATSRLDTRELTRRVAQRKSLLPLPRENKMQLCGGYWLLCDDIAGMLPDVRQLIEAFARLPQPMQPAKSMRLSTTLCDGWFGTDGPLHPSTPQAPPPGMRVIVVANRTAPTAFLKRVLHQWRCRFTQLIWLDPNPVGADIYWDYRSPVIVRDDSVLQKLLSLLYPYSNITRAMVRDLRHALGAPAVVESEFWDHEDVRVSGIECERACVHYNRELHAENLRTWWHQAPEKVNELHQLLEKHRQALAPLYRHEAALNLPVKMISDIDRKMAVDFFCGLALATTAHDDSRLARAQHSVVLSVKERLVGKADEKLNTAVAVSQKAWVHIDPVAAAKAGVAQNAMSEVVSDAVIAATVKGFELREASGVPLARVKLADSGGFIENNSTIRPIQTCQPLPQDQFILKAATENLQIDITDTSRFYWAESLTQSAQGLTLETSEGVKVIYSVHGGGPVIEKPADHNWLNTATTGVDDYGLYTTLSLFGLEQRMRWIPSGRFVMGSPEEELERESNETQHPVVLTEGFWLADTTCTQQLWKAVTGMNPSRFEGARNPVERVSWGDVQYFIDKINKQHPELRLSLPTEAQWEYACRAGTTGPFSTGATITTGQANFNGKRSYANTEKGEYRRKTIPVDALAPNPWGMLQMHGNVFEWCQDWYGKYPEGEVINPTGTKDGAGRVLRGGSWFYGGRGCRSAFRTPLEPVRRSDDVGFRLSQAGFVSSNSKQ